jgi:hypothetical protein
MSYYPILDIPGVSGWTKLYNFPPNNWEARREREQWVNFTYSTGEKWVTESLGKLPFGEVRTVTADELRGRMKTNAIALLSLTHNPLPPSSLLLPVLGGPTTTIPAWRATIGLSSAWAQTSYQGELDTFPPSGTLLTFGPFLQYGIGIENYLIFLNAENSAVTRSAEIEIYDASGLNLKGRFTVRNNSPNMIALDDLGLNAEDLPLIICREMAGIPLYFSRTTDGAFMSLEHTHPPASFVVRGSRWEAQKLLKKHWFTKVSS